MFDMQSTEADLNSLMFGAEMAALDNKFQVLLDNLG